MTRTEVRFEYDPEQMIEIENLLGSMFGGRQYHLEESQRRYRITVLFSAPMASSDKLDSNITGGKQVRTVQISMES